MAVDAGRVTAAELLQMPDDGMRHELVCGEIRVMPPPGFAHGRVALRIGGILLAHAENTGSGVAVAAETGFILSKDPDTVRAPDAAFISQDRIDALGDTPNYWPEAPALAVEVVSPSDSFQEVEEKALAWLAGGAIAVLVLDPARQTGTVYRGGGEARVHSGDDTLELGEAVPGLSVPLARLFSAA